MQPETKDIHFALVLAKEGSRDSHFDALVRDIVSGLGQLGLHESQNASTDLSFLGGRTVFKFDVSKSSLDAEQAAGFDNLKKSLQQRIAEDRKYEDLELFNTLSCALTEGELSRLDIGGALFDVVQQVLGVEVSHDPDVLSEPDMEALRSVLIRHLGQEVYVVLTVMCTNPTLDATFYDALSTLVDQLHSQELVAFSWGDVEVETRAKFSQAVEQCQRKAGRPGFFVFTLNCQPQEWEVFVENRDLMLQVLAKTKFLIRLDTNPYHLSGYGCFCAPRDTPGAIRTGITQPLDGATPVGLAVARGDIDGVRRHLQMGGEVDATGPDGMTPLMTAASVGHLGIVELLVKAGASVNAVKPVTEGMDDAKWTALSFAVRAGHLSIVRLLVNAGANLELSDTSDWTPLFLALANGRTEIAKELVHLGASVRARTNNAVVPLALAAAQGHAELVTLLLQAGSDVNTRDVNRVTPLHSAAVEGHVGIARILLEAGAEVDCIMIHDWTPLMCAAMYGHLELVDLLVHAGADVHLMSDEGFNALMYAERRGHQNVASHLIDAGAVSY